MVPIPMDIAITILSILHVFVALLLTLIILWQRPRQEGLGVAFGGGVSDQMFGAQATNVLQKGTVYLGVIFFLNTLLIAGLMSHRSARQGKSGLLEQAAAAPPPVPTAPATPPETPATPAAPPTPESAESAPAADPTPAEPTNPEAVAPPAPADTAPADTAPADTAPADTAPADTAPAKPTTPETTEPAPPAESADQP